MVSVATPSLSTLWARTSGSDAARATKLIELAQTSGIPADDQALRRVVDLVTQRNFARVSAMFTAEPSSARAHDIRTHGLRSGGFASVRRDLEVTARNDLQVARTARNEPTPLCFSGMFSKPYRLSDAQRDWVETGIGPRPAACGITDGVSLEPFARDLYQLTLRVWAGRQSQSNADPQLERLLACAIDNLCAARTTTTVEAVVKAGNVADILSARRFVAGLEADAFDNGSVIPELRALPHDTWATLLGTANVATPVREDLGHLVEAGRYDLAAAYTRVLGRYAPTPHNVDALTVASLVQSGAFALAASRLSGARSDTALANLRSGLASDPPRVSSTTLSALERDGNHELVHALRQRGVTEADGTMTLTAPTGRSVDELIAAGQRRLPQELVDAGREARRLKERMRRESPPTRATSEAYALADSALFRHMDVLMQDIVRNRNSDGGDQRYAIVADSVETGRSIKGSYVEVHGALLNVLRLTSGRGIACFDRIDAAGARSSISKTHGSIDLIALAKAHAKNTTVHPRRDVFHEVGHAAEFSDPSLAAACRAWRERRATGAPVTLRSAGYAVDGMMVPGDFVTPYVGRLYDDGDTEVMAIGLEHFTGPSVMAGFYEADPEHFCLILGWLES